MIAVIDYGMGNLRSVQKALEKIGAKAIVTSDAKEVEESSKLVLPGVGAFKDGAKELKRRGLTKAVQRAIDSKKPFLGICLGLQLLFSKSEEGGLTSGLGIIKGKCKRFNFRDETLKVPHMGWNQIKIKNSTCPLLNGIEDNSFMYFVHSYFTEVEDKDIIATETSYGIEFVSMIWKENIFAMQFHPEKSQELGLKILENFVRLKC